MYGSLDLKRKRLMEDDYGRTSAESYNQGKTESKERYRAILHMIALLDEMLDMAGMFDIQAEKTRLKAKLHLVEEELQAINVPFIDLDKLGNDGRHHASEAAQKGAPAVKVQPIEVPTIPVSELKEATDDFGSTSLIGEGSYGRVYYGVLTNQQPAAIKKLGSNKQPDSEFLAQVSMVSRLKHDNFVQLLGYCVDGNSRILAYEFAKMDLFMTFFMVEKA
ncbi:hypothetical protein Bca52824_028038 [Brassica carinata]|uniref:Protein kinase domain-containing protein n=1 Tax=Brassica carinata TaxID=52824 RepID=A0A8X8AM98_BRACI|nr:hypothetical protein Bca52824_028038 [Brassica carinata]